MVLYMPFPAKDPHIRFWDNVDIPEAAETDCWLWTAQLRHGYGLLWLPNKKQLKAHRISYEIHYGEIPDGSEVRHSCHNRTCVNPYHLSIGTKADNMRDMSAAGRQWNQKLTHEQVLEIRVLRETMTRNAIAKLYGVSKACIDKKLSSTYDAILQHTAPGAAHPPGSL